MMRSSIAPIRVVPVGLLGLIVLAACLEDRAPHLDCGAGGDAFAYRGADYCVYSAAIIIEGFDCPALVPFPHEEGDLFICASSQTPPPEGWEQLVVAWENEGHERPGGDATDATDTTDTAEVGPTDPGLCVDGLAYGQCWGAAQCPDGWSCLGASVACTPCVDCGSPVPGTPGTCAPPEVGGARADALGLVAWPTSGTQDTAVVYWWLANPIYAVLECPSFSTYVSDGAGNWNLGPAEANCGGAIAPPAAVVIPRPTQSTGAGGPITVRATGRYLYQCGGVDPSTCTAEQGFTSNPVTLRGP